MISTKNLTLAADVLGALHEQLPNGADRDEVSRVRGLLLDLLGLDDRATHKLGASLRSKEPTP